MFNATPENASTIVKNKWFELGPINLNQNYFKNILQRTDLTFGRSLDSIYLHGQIDKQRRLQGLGRTVFQSGNLHEGEYRDDKRHGWGRFIWADGAYYDGMWKDGMRHGQGKFVHGNGDIDEGIWDKGEMVTPTGAELTDGDQQCDIVIIPSGQKDILVDPQTSSLAQ